MTKETCTDYFQLKKTAYYHKDDNIKIDTPDGKTSECL